MSFLSLLRRLFVGSPQDLVAEATEHRQRRLPPTPDEELLRELKKQLRAGDANLLFGYTAEGEEIRIPLRILIGLHLWASGGTGSGKSALALAIIIQLLIPNAGYNTSITDAKGEIVPWITDKFLPATLLGWDEKDGIAFLDNMRVIDPFDPQNIPALNILLPLKDVPRAIQAREISAMITEILGTRGGSWGPRMNTILSFASRAGLDLGTASLLEVRALLMQPEYLNAVIPYLKDRDVKDYFVYRFGSESKEAIRAVISRLDLLLIDQTARVLCAPSCIDFGEVLEAPFSLINVGNAPRGAEFLSQWWLGVFVRNLSRAILGRRDTSKPCFCILDEWWTALDLELATHFERLLTLARHKRVGLWLLNQLAGQVSSRSPVLLSTIKNSCGIHIAFRQSHEDAAKMSYMLPVSEHMKVKKTPDSPAWDLRTARPEEQRRILTEEFTRLPTRHFWLYPKILGKSAVHLTSPEIPFDEVKKIAAEAPDWFINLCRGHGKGLSHKYLDSVVEMRRSHIYDVAQGIVATPLPDLNRRPYEVRASSQFEVEAPTREVVQESIARVQGRKPAKEKTKATPRSISDEKEQRLVVKDKVHRSRKKPATRVRPVSKQTHQEEIEVRNVEQAQVPVPKPKRPKQTRQEELPQQPYIQDIPEDDDEPFLG